MAGTTEHAEFMPWIDGPASEPFLKISWENDTPDAIVALLHSCARRVCRINDVDVYVRCAGQRTLLCTGWDDEAGEPRGVRFTIRFEDIREIVFY